MKISELRSNRFLQGIVLPPATLSRDKPLTGPGLRKMLPQVEAVRVWLGAASFVPTALVTLDLQKLYTFGRSTTAHAGRQGRLISFNTAGTKRRHEAWFGKIDTTRARRRIPRCSRSTPLVVRNNFRRAAGKAKTVKHSGMFSAIHSDKLEAVFSCLATALAR